MPSAGRDKKKVLFVVNHRKDRSPGQRYRFEQYLKFLEEKGFDIDISFLINEKDDKLFYAPGNYLAKGRILLKSLLVRLGNLIKLRSYHVIFIYREALPVGLTLFEKLFARSKAKIIFDFDDAIWLPTVSAANKSLGFLKDASKTSHIIQLSDVVFAGNQYLADYAAKYNSNVVIIPSTIDTAKYSAVKEVSAGPVCIGWSGSFSTIEHFELAIPALERIKNKYGSGVKFRVIGDPSYVCDQLEVRGEPWSSETEVKDLLNFDIGIMPLADDDWAKGKCGMKGLQYMALGIPALLSPVGVNTEIIENGVNGFLPSTEDEWVRDLSILIEDAGLRKRMGLAGKETVEKRFSVNAWKDRYVEEFEKLVNSI